MIGRPNPSRLERVVIAGIPRCGTTLIANYLGAQEGCYFLAEYFSILSQLPLTLSVTYRDRLDLATRRAALLLVRSQMLRLGHVLLVGENDFNTVDELSYLALRDLGGGQTRVVGHKVVLQPSDVRTLLAETDVHVVVAYRDPRDAALSWMSRRSGPLSPYLTDYRRMVRLICEDPAPGRLHGVSFEAMVRDPELALQPLAETVGLRLNRPAHLDARLRANHDRMTWTHNSAHGDVSRPFDPVTVSRWRRAPSSAVVRYAEWYCGREIAALGYGQGETPTPTEATRFAMDMAARRVSRAVQDAAQWVTQRIDRTIPPLS